MKVFIALLVLVLLGVGALYIYGLTASPEQRTVEVEVSGGGS